jgi:hypothetical protein
MTYLCLQACHGVYVTSRMVPSRCSVFCDTPCICRYLLTLVYCVFLLSSICYADTVVGLRSIGKTRFES